MPGQARWDAWVPSAPWLVWSRETLCDFTHVLGVVALGPALRVILQRDRVLFLREATGSEAWRVMQAHDPWHRAPPETVRHLGCALLRRCGGDGDALQTALFRRGLIEFTGHAERADELLAARLRLSFVEQLPGQCGKECWLPAEAVDQLLSEQHAVWQAATNHDGAEVADAGSGEAT